MTVPGALFVRNLLVERRSLLFQLVRRDFEQRYVGSAAGWIWGLVQPLVLLLSYSFVFGVCLGQGSLMKNYPLFLFAGMLPWLLFAETVQRSASSLLDQANLITKTVFPAEVVPISIFLSSLISHLMALTLVLVAAAIYVEKFTVGLALIPVYVLFLGMMAVGLGWVVSSLQVYLRDTSQMLMVVLTFWFWLTPIFITEEQFPAWGRFLIEGNPLTYVVRAYRDVLVSAKIPNLEDLGIFALCAIGMFVAGGLFFRYMKRGFADVL